MAVEDKRFAVLIDSDNISSKYITCILDEMTKYGVITYSDLWDYEYSDIEVEE
ncbi:MAG: hypothetical protein ACLTXL_09530 [Clostridia bacterium]